MKYNHSFHVALIITLFCSCMNDTEDDPADFRSPFVGAYTGFRDCSAWNTNQVHPDQAMTIQVDYGDQPNYLSVDGEQIQVDSSGSFPHPYFNGYRQYGLSFKGDSIFIHQQWGAPNANETCKFRGKKNN